MWRRELNIIRTRKKNCPEICDPASVSGSVPFLAISRHPVHGLYHSQCLSGHPVRGLSCYVSGAGGVQDNSSAFEPSMLKDALVLTKYLKNIKFQVVGVVFRPKQDRMIRSLGAEFSLAETDMSISGCLCNSPGKELLIHEVGAGTGRKESAVLYQAHSPEVDFAVALCGSLD